MKFIKGQLHIHTSVSDGDADPKTVAQEFRDMGYDFVAFTDHTAPYDASVYSDNNLTVLSGTEWAAVVNNPNYRDIVKLHVNAVGYYKEDNGILDAYAKQYNDFFGYPNVHNTKNVRENQPYCEASVSQTLNNMLAEVYRQGGIPTVNHPNWFNFDFHNPKAPETVYENGILTEKKGQNFAPFDYRELLGVDYPYILEVKNVSLPDFSAGYKSLESSEYIWDVLLTKGKNVLACFSDDSHNYKREIRNKIHDFQIPGQTSVMVNAENNENNIKEALKKGKFYASNGIELDYYEVMDNKIR
ncbi:MAG: hypothetical protein KBT47_04775, partial [Armatimonadetes bacterium]|nr:hypothetical protein [Candidatus Hippobium faecium]